MFDRDIHELGWGLAYKMTYRGLAKWIHESSTGHQQSSTDEKRKDFEETIEAERITQTTPKADPPPLYEKDKLM